MAIDLARDIVLRWDVQEPALAPLLKEGGVNVVLAPEPSPAFRDACRAAGIEAAPASELALLDVAGFREANGGPAAVAEGLWPGASRAPSGDPDTEVASASRLPWVDANGFRIAYLKALCPGRHPVLAYLPDADAGVSPDRLVAYETHELALIEAWVNGGNYVLAVEPRYRAALLAGDGKALAAWRQLGRTARWLQEHWRLFGLSVFPQVTALVEPGYATAELAKMLYRHNASPKLEAADSLAESDPSRRLVIVAAGLEPPAAPVRDRILAHAAGGATVVTAGNGDAPWWRVDGLGVEREEPDRVSYRLGRGRLVAYKEEIVDPSEFALDVIDLATHPRRALRVWGASALVATATEGPPAGPLRARALLHAINYGSPLEDVLAYVQGHYGRAVLLRPEAGALSLKTARRGSATEVRLPELRRVGAVVFE